MAELKTLQKWLTSIMVRPGQLHDKISLADRHYELNHTELIKASGKQSPAEKIGIYARGYVLRLMECMEAEFPVLKQLLGDQLFDTFAGAYLSRLPPYSYDLYDLGHNFPDFLEVTKPKPGTTEPENSDFALPAELARLERALAEVSRSPGLENFEKNKRSFSSESLPFFFLTHTDFRVAPTLKLLRQQFNLTHFVKAVQQNREAETPEPEETFVAVTRVNYAVMLFALEAWQWQFLTTLENTQNYDRAVNACVENSGIPKDELLADLLLWLPVAESSGLVFRPA